MDFKSFLPKSNKEVQSEGYWTVIVEPGWVQSGIWSIEHEKAKLVSVSPPSAWAEDSELAKSADSALSSSIQLIPENVSEPHKTVFGVISSWVENDQIKKEHVDKIKNLSSELALNPVGFVVLPEALAYYYKFKEQSPLNSIIVGIFSHQLEISVFKLGNLAGTTMVGRSISIADDIVEGLSRFMAGGNLPSRMMFYNGKEEELDEEMQALSKISWEDYEKISFLHTPKLETISTENKVFAVSLAGARDVAGISQIEGLIPPADVNELSHGYETESNVSNVDMKSFGFSIGKDITDLNAFPENEIDGIDNEYGPRDEVSSNLEPHNYSNNQQHLAPVHQVPTTEIGGKVSKFKVPTFNLSKATGLVHKLPFKKLSFLSKGSSLIIIASIIFLFLFILGFVGWWFLPKAEVTVYVETSQLEEKLETKIDPSIQSTDIANVVLPGQIREISVEGEKTKSTTGNKTVGDNAKGEITIYRVGSELELELGTEISSSGSLKFTLDEATKIASGSASSPSSTTVAVTASSIGAEYNLAENSTFSVANYSTSDLEAKNSSSFSGGSSRDIQAVSKDDIDDLEEALADELKTKAIDDLKSSIRADCSECTIIEESYESDIVSSDYSGKVGDEADTVSLELKLNAKFVAIKKPDIYLLAQEILKDRIPSGFVLRDEQILVDFEFSEKTEDDVYKMSTQIKANLLPDIKPDEISQKIAGKYPSLAENYFNTEISGFTKAEINIYPKLPGRLGTLPHKPGNIDIIISAQK